MGRLISSQEKDANIRASQDGGHGWSSVVTHDRATHPQRHLRILIPAALACAVAVATVLALSRQDASAACGANPCMTVDADAATAGIQPSITVASGGQFKIALEATSAGTTQGYQWELQWQAAVLDPIAVDECDAVSADCPVAHGATLCAPAADNTGGGAPPGTEWYGGGAGCLRTSGAMAASYRMTVITLQCMADGPTQLH